jgi:hypothetical protein
MSLSRIDKDAMRRAIAMVRARDKRSRDHIDSMRRTDPFEEVGTFAASSCQSRNLGLKPWQCPPVWIDNLDAALRLPFDEQNGDRAAKLARF